MATTKSAKKKETKDLPPDPHSAAYNAAVEVFSQAIDCMQQGRFDEAKEFFEKIEPAVQDEPVLVARTKSYIRICEQKLEGTDEELTSPDDLYRAAVMKSNDGQMEEAIRLLDRAIEANPTSSMYIYARASAYALKGDVDGSIADLRRAISFDPQIRFHAVNDADFEGIRDEPAFIDIIEPTSGGI